MITYESALSDSYPAKGRPTLRDVEWRVIAAMEAGGATIILEKQGEQHIVKVRHPGKRQIRTVSTSGYPIQHAFEKWMLENGPTV